MPKKAAKSVFSVAMSRQTGCLVMIRTNGTQVTVIGSLDKEMSESLSKSILAWSPESPADHRAAYPH